MNWRIWETSRSKIALGALLAGLDTEGSRSSGGFTWAGFDEIDEVSGDGSAEPLDDGAIEIGLACHSGPEAVLKAKDVGGSIALIFAVRVRS